MTDVDFTFAVVNWNTRDLLRECLASIFAARGPWTIQVLVTDNASSDGSAAMVRVSFPEVELVCLPENRGFAGGHEPLFARAKGRYHVLVNSDVRLFPGSLATLDARMQADPSIGILGCQVIGPDGDVQATCRRFPSLWRQLVEASGLNRLLPNFPLFAGYRMGDFDHRHSRSVDQVMGAMFLIRREVVQRLGPLNTDYFMYYEEVEYCLRCRRAGYEVFFEADAQVYHEGCGSSRLVRELTVRRTMRSMRHYFRKWHGAWTWLPLLAIVSLDGVTHTAFALIKRQQPFAVARAYAKAWWDVLTWKRADL